MAKIDELTVDVSLSVSEETVVACVTLINLYLRQNEYADVVTEKENGHNQIHIVDKATTEE